MSDLQNKLQEKAGAVAEKKGQSTEATVWNMINKMKDSIEAALPSHMDTGRFVRVIWTSIRQNPKLLTCSKDSLVAAVMQATQLGLEPGVLGQAYLIPYWNGKLKQNEVQFQIGYRGYIDLARRSGELQSLFADVAYDKDKFEFEYGTSSHLKHVPFLDGDRGRKKAVYAVATFKDGSFVFVVLPIGEVERIRDQYSKSADREGKPYGPWITEFDEMAKKTAIKRLMKLVPLSVETLRKLAADETVKAEIKPDMSEVLDANSAVSEEALGGTGEVIDVESETVATSEE